jgi:hypothetical protein
LLPKLIRSRVDFLFAGFSHTFSPSWSTAPSGMLGRYRRTCHSESSPHAGRSFLAETAPQDKGQAGVTPHGLSRDCPAPREDSVSGNRTPNRRERSGRRGAMGELRPRFSSRRLHNAFD